MLKKFFLLIFFLLALFWVKMQLPSFWVEVNQYIENRDILLLSPHEEFSLLEGRLKRAFQQKGMALSKNVQLYYYPFLVIDGEYRSPQMGKQKLLWCLTTGELILNTQSWKKTCGLKMLLKPHLGEGEIAVLNELASFGGKQQEKQLLARLGVSPLVLQNSCQNLVNCKLISKEGMSYKLEIPRSHFFVCPQTEWIEPPSLKQAPPLGKVLPSSFSKEQVLGLVEQGVFGKGFYPKASSLVYLPVYVFQINTSDGKSFYASWNALNGRALRKEEGYPGH